MSAFIFKDISWYIYIYINKYLGNINYYSLVFINVSNIYIIFECQFFSIFVYDGNGYQAETVCQLIFLRIFIIIYTAISIGNRL